MTPLGRTSALGPLRIWFGSTERHWVQKSMAAARRSPALATALASAWHRTSGSEARTASLVPGQGTVGTHLGIRGQVRQLPGPLE